MITKKEQAIKLFYDDPKKALMFCKKWSDLGHHKSDIIRGAECLSNGNFYSQLGFNIDECIYVAIKHLKSHLGIS